MRGEPHVLTGLAGKPYMARSGVRQHKKVLWHAYLPIIFRSAQSSSDASVPVDILHCQAGQQ